MVRMRFLTGVLVLLLGSALGGTAVASPPPNPPPKDAPKDAAKPSGKEKMLREKVGLDAAKAKKVADVLAAQKAARHPARDAIKAAFHGLDEVVKNPKSDDAALTAAIAKVDQARAKLDQLETTQRAAVVKLLSPREQARYLLATRKVKKHDKDDKPKAKVDPKSKPPASDKAKDDDDDDE